MTLIEKVRNALRITTNNSAAINDELTDLIEAAKKDLGIAGVILQTSPLETENAELIQEEDSQTIVSDELVPIITKAIITYCKMSFGLPEDYDRLKRSYDEQKAQLSNATGFTNWEVTHV